MVLQGLSPGMENRGDADLGAEMARITIRWLSMSPILRRTTSDTRNPAA